VTKLFLYGTLLDPATLAAEGGNAALAERLTPAVLPGWRRVRLRRTPYPTLRRDRAGQTRGALLVASASVLARLITYEGPAYRLRRVVVRTARGKTAAQVWIAPGGTSRPWRG
jgi:gamma-glutamylcyclotransferase (GGCT)/AIG2-like uncharacterized protein YtfP